MSRKNHGHILHPLTYEPIMSLDSLPFISSMFLAKFDVHSGYKLKWFKSNNDQIYTPNNLEFKALPSGLHSVSSDTICFVQQKAGLDDKPIDGSDLLYGLTVFRQNTLAQQQMDSVRQEQRAEDQTDTTVNSVASIDRSKVKLFSLGILIDPEHLRAGQSPSLEIPWKPKIYAACWQYRHDLMRIMDEFIECGTEKDERLFYVRFDRYFELHRFKVPFENSDAVDLTTASSALSGSALNDAATRRASMHASEHASEYVGHQLATPSEHVESVYSETIEPSSVAPSASSLDTSFKENLLSEGHMVYGLLDLFNTLGPLLYKLWRLSLLRKKVIFYVKSQGSVVKPNDDAGGDSIKITDLSRFIYCLSLISSIPKEIRTSLVKSGIIDFDSLETHLPVYNLCVNDLDFIKNIHCGFIGSTSDQIILEKPDLYDYCVRLKRGSATEIISSDGKTINLGSHRDLEAFEVVKSMLDDGDIDNSIDFVSTCDSASVREIIWRGLSWWATAGESSEDTDRQFQLETSNFEDLASNDNSTKETEIIALVGYFQKLTTRLFNMLMEVVVNNESDVNNEMSESSSTLLGTDNDHGVDNTSTIWVRFQDMYEMGLDPYSSEDCHFVEQLIKLWWAKEAKVGSPCTKLCCLYG
ncbi:hypothetical protein FOA43_001104 [Brettanomyces nanus]|uniref:DUF4484 domain-containing protein n=1 Tax=Eeniella nana TaxID=13502 RepID=A0A875RNI7_EENNA|nr:uncharacterized protein FOA43_001104 [Brettanomyces nanus]QPG73790.1 hypothetical protein FOA43_001104 [Brettanomyces nanus]